MYKKRIFRELAIVIALITVLSTLIYHRSLFLFFAQDDFYLLSISQAEKPVGFLRLFLPHPDTAWYRPLSQQVFFWFGQKFFGLNPLPFHIVLFITHWINSLLLFFLLRRFCQSFLINIVGVLFYALNISHFLSLSWPAAYGFLLGPTGFLATILMFFSYLKRKTGQRFFFTFILFVISLLIVEVNIVLLPIFIGLWFIIDHKEPLKSRMAKSLLVLFPFILFSLLILILRFIVVPAKVGGAYQFTSSHFFSTMRFYLFRLFGLAQSVRLVDFNFSLLQLITVSILVVLGFFVPFVTQARKLIFNRGFQTGAVITFFSLLPFLLLPFHLSPHYLSFSLIGMSLILVVFISQFRYLLTKKQMLIYINVLILSIISASVIGERMEWQSHWIVKRAELANSLIEKGFYTAPVGSEEYFALGAGSAQIMSSK